ncbi:MAG: translation initiation factor IF-3 [Acidobacteria bacterium]|nr:translation initiation factor IF-3 [Acidobacteriota bacterium]
MNEKIRAKELRVIDEEGGQLGIMTPADALSLAQSKGLDLVEVAPTSVPPVCRILDYGKYIYEQNKKQHDAKKKQKHVHVKEVKFRPKTEEHDYEFKRNHIARFLKQGDKVKVSIMFRGREMQHLDYGKRILDRVIVELEGIAIIEAHPRVEGHFMSMFLAPKKGLVPEKPAPPVKAEAAKPRATRRAPAAKSPAAAKATGTGAAIETGEAIETGAAIEKGSEDA